MMFHIFMGWLICNEIAVLWYLRMFELEKLREDEATRLRLLLHDQ